ncbi:hypothetical protein AVEN_143156-1 [Araneus ventricosus]|uniref:Uncharacterized protein n=1 Tax=Araneus ventricosus TaxID=182803 RepID=A0A4Y2JS29_ARAVE|nr:hypothetical protein AVEN_143156-1 [Araneus ventricosus]
MARESSRRLKVSWSFDNDSARIHFQDLELRANSRRRIMNAIRERLRTERAQALQNDYARQGKVMKCVALSPASSHFYSDGAYTRFADWRFVFKARLGQVPLNGYKPWKAIQDQGCRYGDADRETLPHVLCHCNGRLYVMTLRHNALVTRVVKAITPKVTIISENRQVQGTNMRPDIIVQFENQILIIDITVTFEDEPDAFHRARERKKVRYNALLDHFKTPTNHVEIFAFVMGA